MKLADFFIAGLVLLVVMLIIIPLGTAVLDILLIINIALSVFILLTTLNIKEPLEFSILPTLLLITTLFRLSLNVSSTRLILGNGGNAGDVIATFGNFVIGGNLVVGLVVFLIIIAIQFIVITKGAERVAEVAARFALDAMPGKQMSIDADLNTGAIDEVMARQRRLDIQRESDFYGSMDGASKFIKGDAIIGIIITLINIVGGLIIGVVMEGMEAMEAVQIYTLATVGDGLVSQIPALLISTSMGVVVTRASSDNSFGVNVSNQLFSKPYIFLGSGSVVLLLSLVPGLPKLPMILISVGLIAVGYTAISKSKKKTEAVQEVASQAEAAAEEKRKPENIASLLKIEPVEFEFGYGIIPMVDTNLGGDLLERIVMIRRQCALEMGVIVPSIRLRDNVQLHTNEYVLKIKGQEVARGEVMADHVLAINAAGTQETISGIETVDPAFGMPALWINKNVREKAELLGYTTFDPPSVIATHLTELIKQYSYELMNRQQVQTLMDNLKAQQPALVEEATRVFSLGEIQKVLVNLLRESVPIRDMATILETLADYGVVTKDTDLLTEYVRQGMRRTITRRFVQGDEATVITLEPQLEQLILERSKQNEVGSSVAIEPSQMQSIILSIKDNVESLSARGKTPVVLTSPLVRRKFKKIAEMIVPDLAVLSYNELDQNIEIHSEGVIRV